MPAEKTGRHAWTAVVLSTLAFAVCFACWVINAVLVTYLASQGIIALNESQVGWLLAVPILTGAVSRVPLGIVTDRFGGRRILFLLMLVTAVPLFLLSYAGSFTHLLLASLGFGLAGGSFAVGVGYVSAWTPKAQQGTALGTFGMGNAGAAITTAAAPLLLGMFTHGGAQPEGWRLLPRVYAGALVLMAFLFFALTRERAPAVSQGTLAERLAPLKSLVVWRLGLYYSLVFGGFVALSQWIIPYSVNVYHLSVAQAGLLAASFSLPAGLIRAAGGWLADRFGARTVMYWVFGSCAVICLLLSVPRLDVRSPGEGLLSAKAGTVTAVTAETVEVGPRAYRLASRPARTPSELDDGSRFLPAMARWQEPAVQPGQTVQKKELLARGITNIYYPANLWLFGVLVVLFGAVSGIGTAGVFKFIPEQFPQSVGAVGGMVGLIGALGGFVFPPLFGALMRAAGLWSTCWTVLLVLSLACLACLHRVVTRMMAEEAPDLARLIERRPDLVVGAPLTGAGDSAAPTARELLERIPFFADLSPEELKQLGEIAALQTVRSGEAIFAEGDPGDRLYVLVEGSVRIDRNAPEGKIEIAVLGPGDYFGELALLDGRPRSAGATALQESRLLSIGRQEFLARLSASPRMVADLLVGLSGRVRGSLDRLHRVTDP